MWVQETHPTNPREIKKAKTLKHFNVELEVEFLNGTVEKLISVVWLNNHLYFCAVKA